VIVGLKALKAQLQIAAGRESGISIEGKGAGLESRATAAENPE
jgi:hypothetical protein